MMAMRTGASSEMPTPVVSLRGQAQTDVAHDREQRRTKCSASQSRLSPRDRKSCVLERVLVGLFLVLYMGSPALAVCDRASCQIVSQAPAKAVKNLGPPLGWKAGEIYEFITYGSEILFEELPTNDGRPDEGELWKTDGTDAGTVLVKDINPTGPSLPVNFELFNGAVWFSADDGVHGREIWRTDGTEDGTTLFMDFSPGSAGSDPYFQATPGYLAFTADDGSGRKLWRTDGTVAGTSLLTPPEVDDAVLSHAGCPGHYIQNFVCTGASGNRVFFLAHDSTFGYEPWVTDGTPAGTVRLADTVAGSDGVFTLHFAGRGDGTGYFTVFHNGLDLDAYTTVWRTDGTPAGTTRIAGPNVGGWVIDVGDAWIVTNPDGTATFAADRYNGDGLLVGSSIWRTDGTASGTNLLAAYSTSPPDPMRDTLIELRGTSKGLIYYVVRTGDFDATAYRTDGTRAGTSELGLDPGFGMTVATMNGTTIVGGDQLYAVDETSAATVVPLANVYYFAGLGGLPAAGNYVVTGNLLRLDISGATAEIQPASTVVTGDRSVDEPGHPDIDLLGLPYAGKFVDLGGSLLYANANDELWRTDGTDAGTFSLSPVHYAGAYNFVAYDERTRCFDHLGGLGLFKGPDDKLWRTDGTVAGTAAIGAGAFVTTCPSDVGGTGFFFSQDPHQTPGPLSLWRTDGTVGGTQDVLDFGGTYGIQHSAIAAGSTAFLTLNDGTGNGVWASDGTAGGTTQLTTQVADAVYPDLDFYNFQGVGFGGSFYFFAVSSGRCWLWKSDGSPGGTQPFVPTDVTTCGQFGLAQAAGRLFFSSYRTATDHAEIWTTDGTTASMIATVGDALDGYVELYAVPQLMIGGDTGVYFAQYQSSTGSELWTSDGTAAGTHMIRDILPGPDGSLPMPLTTVNGILFFIANDGSIGRELWRTDGTDAGTWLVANVGPGVTGSVGPAGVLGSTVFFSAPDVGRRGTAELFKVDNLATCGNGVVDPGEECDDGNGDNTDACTTTCHFNVCGDGFVRAGVEDCDDGNTADGDCCSSTCTFESAGSACPDDGDLCSDDRCDGAGRCAHAAPINSGVVCRPAAGPCDVAETCDGIHAACPMDAFDTGSVCHTGNAGCADEVCSGTAASCPVTAEIFGCRARTLTPIACAASPLAGCRLPIAPVTASLILKNAPGSLKDSLAWKWKDGAATTLADFGDPVNQDSYALCFYDESGPPQLLYEMKAPGGAAWKATPSNLKYASQGSPNGLTKISLKPGATGKAQVQAKGKGSYLPFGSGASPLPLPLRVQFQAGNGNCWESHYSTALENDGKTFKASSD